MTADEVEGWFKTRGWKAFGFQRAVWDRMRGGASGLLHSPTGTGKTLAVWFGALLTRTQQSGRILWITPMRALAADTALALRETGVVSLVGLRTGDVAATARRRQIEAPPDALVTTPESLCVLISQPSAGRLLQGVTAVIVDEWHELMGTKRGVQVELALGRLRALNPGLLVWGLSATIGNLEEAARTLAGDDAVIVTEGVRKVVEIETVLPDAEVRFPWAGHLGLALAPRVADIVSDAASALVFTNTRSQAELWHAELARLLPGKPLALHHSSVARALREAAEEGLKSGAVRVVVATSSLDLGVDFAPVDRVIQIGSPKGVARLLQRAGRSGHGPGRTSRIFCVPANTFEFAEIAAARRLANAGVVESRPPLRAPLDVLAQHVLTVAAGTGVGEDQLLAEVRSTSAFRGLTQQDWEWVVDFVAAGGSSLRAYPDFQRLERSGATLEFRSEALARRHRMTIGTITADAAVEVRMVRGAKLGEVEESFISRLKPGDAFLFAGRRLALVRMRGMSAWVRPARAGRGTVPQWMGGRMPLSTELADGVRSLLAGAATGIADAPEMVRLEDILAVQEHISMVPGAGDLLLESARTREGWHTFLFPFEGRTVHEGIAALLAWRLAEKTPLTLTYAVNDYGIEWLSNEEIDPSCFFPEGGLLNGDNLADDIPACINAGELSKRQFREIARVAGLTFEGFPGKRKAARQIQVSSGLLYDVFQKYEPDNLLLRQAGREVMESRLAASRLAKAFEAMRARQLVVRHTAQISPLAYPLYVERLRAQLSSEEVEARLARMDLPYVRG